MVFLTIFILLFGSIKSKSTMNFSIKVQRNVQSEQEKFVLKGQTNIPQFTTEQFVAKSALKKSQKESVSLISVRLQLDLRYLCHLERKMRAGGAV